VAPDLGVGGERRAGHEGVEGRPEILADRVALREDLVAGIGQHHEVPGPHPGGEPLRHRRAADRIGPGGDDQGRQGDAGGGPGIAQARHRPERLREPCDGRVAHRPGSHLPGGGGVAGVARRIPAQAVAGEGLGGDRDRLAEGDGPAAKAQAVQ
jgi:hypothetical protein